MSVAGYLGSNAPKSRKATTSDMKCDTRNEGELIEREKSAAERQRQEAIEASKLGRLNGEKLPGGLNRAGHQDRFYEDVETYDPVLRSHCRL